MGERGWQEFLRADGLEDWVMLHGGATVAFRVDSLSRASTPMARLAAALAAGGRIVDESEAPAAWILADRPQT